VEELAQAFGGNSAVAATRAVVDAGWYPDAAQIGQTGKTVAAKLYLAAGISGAIQHKVGMQSSANIVAINKGANRPTVALSAFGEVRKEAIYVLPSARTKVRIPPPPPQRNHGNEIVSVAALARFQQRQAEEGGAYILTETAATQLIVQDGRVVGVRSGDKGRGKDG